MSFDIKRELFEWLKAFIFAAIIVGIFNVFFTATMVYSTSMYPTLVEKDLLVLRKNVEVTRGDIVSVKSGMYLTEDDIKRLNIVQRVFANTDTRKNLIKRVIALPGDSIKITDNQVYINGVLQNETYISSETVGEVDIEKIPENQYFLMGDNRSVSLDSRSEEVGLIPGEDVIGKVIIRIFPFNKIGTVE